MPPPNTLPLKIVQYRSAHSDNSRAVAQEKSELRDDVTEVSLEKQRRHPRSQ
jgi:hypothetical protein